MSHQVFKETVKRYLQVWRLNWDLRHHMDPPARKGDELQFLPAHLELTDTPVSPLPSWGMRIIMLLFFCILLWALIGRLDIVAVASGKLQADGRTKIVQSLEPSVVQAIHVRDGQRVEQGDLLIELDTTQTLASQHQVQEALFRAQLAVARYQALLIALEQNTSPQPLTISMIPAELLKNEQALMLEQWQSYQHRFEGLSSTLEQRKAEQQTTHQQIIKLSNLLKITEIREQDYEKLLSKQFVSRHEWLEQKQKRTELQGELATQQSRIEELAAAIASQQQELAALTAQFRSESLDKMRSAEEQIALQQEELKKIHQRHALTQLTAPISGTVQQLAIHTVGGVVIEAQPLLAIVPDNPLLEAEVQIENKDIGFVKEGQTAVIKIESFPYTRYGYIEGTLENVSHDAMQDEKKGLVYQAKIKLHKNHLYIDDVKVNLTAGMAVSAEIKTGNRQVFDYFLSPLKTYANEGLRER